MKSNMKAVVLSLSLCFLSINLNAGDYVITKVVGKVFFVKGNMPVSVGNIFNPEKDSLRFTKDSDYIKAVPYPNNNKWQEKTISPKRAKGKTITLSDYLKGYYRTFAAKGDNAEMENCFLLIDSLTIGPFDVDEKTQFEAKWNDGRKDVTTYLSASDKKDTIYLTREMFAHVDPQIIELTIWARDRMGSYQIKKIWIDILEE